MLIRCYSISIRRCIKDNKWHILDNCYFKNFHLYLKDSFTGDGSTTTFDLANDVVRGAENALEVFIDNVRQELGTGKAFTLGVDGSNNFRRITFTVPANGVQFMLSTIKQI